MADFPARWGNPDADDYLDNLIVISSNDMESHVGTGNPLASWVSFAPGEGVSVAEEWADRILEDDLGGASLG